MVPGFMQLWLQHAQKKAAPAAAPNLDNLGADVSKGVGKAYSDAVGRRPALYGGPPSAAGDKILGDVNAAMAGLKTPKLDALTAPPAPNPSEAVRANIMGQVERDLAPLRDGGKWFEQASSDDLRALAAQLRNGK